MPWPENLINNIAINKNEIDEILEKKKQENASNRITKKENLEISISSIFFLPKLTKNYLLEWLTRKLSQIVRVR